VSRFAAVFRNCLLVSLLPAALAGCASVDLGQHYQPPPILTPESVSVPAVAAAPAAAPLPAVEAQPVMTGQPQTQPLLPMDGASAAAPALPEPPEPPASAAASESTASPAPSDDPNAHLITFTTRMSGASAVPPADSDGTGQLDALYDSGTGLLRWKAVWSGLSGPITAVQFHGPAERGETGPPTMIWPAPFGPTYEGRATLTPQQAGDLLAGRWYVNVSTDTYPAGEMRGQLRQVP